MRGKLLVQLHQFGDTFGFGVEMSPEAVGFHDCSVVGLMSLAQFWRHEHLVIEVGQVGVWIFGSGIKYALGGFFDFGSLGIRWRAPWEIVVDNILGICVITL